MSRNDDHVLLGTAHDTPDEVIVVLQVIHLVRDDNASALEEVLETSRIRPSFGMH